MNSIYLITNLIDGKQYVGVTCRTVEERFKEHLLEAADGSKSILHNAIRKYGPENFSVVTVEDNIPDDSAEERERYYIKLYQTFYTSCKGYNMTEGGGGVVGYKHSEDSKQKISQSLKGHVFPASRNAKIRSAMIGRDYKQEWKDALSKSRMGRFKGDENPFYGKHHNESTKSKISKANTKHAVIQLDPDTKEPLHTFLNSSDAARWVVATGRSSAVYTTCAGRIDEVCKKGSIYSIAYGYSWRYEESLSTK